MSRRIVLVAAFSALLLAGTACVVISGGFTTGGAAYDPPPADPKSPVEADSAAPGSTDPITDRFSFCWIEGIVLLDGRPRSARVELRQLCPNGVGYEASEYPPAEICLPIRVDAIPTRGFCADEIPLLTRARDPFAAPRAVVQAGPDGRFRFDGLEPGVWEVAAIDAENRAVAVTSEVAPTDRSSRDTWIHVADFVELELPSGDHALNGRIRFADGRPFEGAIRLIETRSGPAEVHRPTVRPDQEGRFCFEHIGERAVWLLAWEPRVVCVWTHHVLLPRAESFEIVLEAPADRFEGRVIDDVTSAPVAGVRIRTDVGGDRLRSFEVGVVSDAEGHFSVPVGGREIVLEVGAEGYLTRSHEPAVDGDIVRLQRLAAIEGRVTNRAGRPLCQVEVVATVYSQNDEEFGTVQRAVTDARGHYRMESLPAGSYTVFVWSPGWVSAGLRDLSAGRFNPLEVAVAPGETAQNDLAAVPTVERKGRVIDSRGRPVPEARILVEKYEPHGFFRRFEDAFVSLTDAEGCFTVQVPPGPFRAVVQVGMNDLQFFSHDPACEGVRRAADGTLTIVWSRFSPPDRTITVEVVDDRGRPVPGARVTWCSGTAWGYRVSALTSVDGRGRLGPVWTDERGDVGELAVSAPGHLGRQCSGSSSGSPGSRLVRVILPRVRLLAGRVLWPDGTPAAGPHVLLTPLSRSSVIIDSWGGWNQRDRESDVDGRFRFVAPFVACRIDAIARRHGRRYEASVEERPDDHGEVELKLEPCPPRVPEDVPGRIEVRLLDSRGRPVQSARVHLYGNGSDLVRSSEVHQDGVCELFHVDPQNRCRWLMITQARDRDGRGLRACIQPLAPEVRGPIEIRLQKECVIEGVVVDADGRPVQGCVVAARYRPTEPPIGSVMEHATARSHAGGRFRLGGLGPFTYSLVVVAWSPEHPAGSPVTVTAPARSVRVPLARGREVRLRFLLEDGRPVEGLEVRIDEGACTSYPEVEGWTDASGLVVFRGLAPDRPHALYTGSEAWGLRDLRVIDLPVCCDPPGWMPRDALFRVHHDPPFTGVVHGADGKPAAGAIVWCKSRGDWVSFTADAEGRFTVSGVPRTATRLRAVPAGAAFQDWRVATKSEVEVAADARHVDVHLPPYRKITVRPEPPPSPGDEREYMLHTRCADGTWAVRRFDSRDDGTAVLVLSADPSGPHRLRVVSRGASTTLAFEGDVNSTCDTVTVPLVPAVTLRIRVQLEPAVWSTTHVEVKVRRGVFTFEAEPVRAAPGEFRVADLVPGPCRVVVAVRDRIGRRPGPGRGVLGWESVETEARAGAVVMVPVALAW